MRANRNSWAIGRVDGELTAFVRWLLTWEPQNPHFLRKNLLWPSLFERAGAVLRNDPSWTATKVQQALFSVARDPQLASLLPIGMVDRGRALLSAAGVESMLHGTWSRKSGIERIVTRVEEALVPGMAVHLALRKRFFWDEARDAIGSGIRQVAVLGAGFDPAPSMLAQAFPEISVIELDHPLTQVAKQQAVKRCGMAVANWQSVAVDLMHAPLASALATVHNWSMEEPALVLAEGLLMYLGELDVVRLLRGIQTRLTQHTRLIFSYACGDVKGRPLLGPRGRFVKWALRAAGEPIRWAMAPESLGAFLAQHGLTQLTPNDGVGSCDLRTRYLWPLGLADLPLVEWEKVAIARR